MGWSLLATALLLGPCGSGAQPNVARPPEFVVVLSDRHANSALWVSSHCFGAVIAPDLVATAAHCAQRRDPSSLRVTAALDDLCTVSEGSPWAQGMTWETEPSGSDLVMLRLDRTLPINPALVHTGPVPAGTRVELLSWGSTRPGGPASCQPKRSTLQVVSRSRCDQKLRSAEATASGQLARPGELCAAPIPGQVGACPGDSGAPLVTTTGMVIGVASRGVGCDENSPGIYASLSPDRPKGTAPSRT